MSKKKPRKKHRRRPARARTPEQLLGTIAAALSELDTPRGTVKITGWAIFAHDGVVVPPYGPAGWEHRMFTAIPGAPPPPGGDLDS